MKMRKSQTCVDVTKSLYRLKSTEGLGSGGLTEDVLRMLCASFMANGCSEPFYQK